MPRWGCQNGFVVGVSPAEWYAKWHVYWTRCFPSLHIVWASGLTSFQAASSLVHGQHPSWGFRIFRSRPSRHSTARSTPILSPPTRPCDEPRRFPWRGPQVCSGGRCRQYCCRGWCHISWKLHVLFLCYWILFFMVKERAFAFFFMEQFQRLYGVGAVSLLGVFRVCLMVIKTQACISRSRFSRCKSQGCCCNEAPIKHISTAPNLGIWACGSPVSIGGRFRIRLGVGNFAVASYGNFMKCQVHFTLFHRRFMHHCALDSPRQQSSAWGRLL